MPTSLPDRSHIITEQRNPRSMNFHTLSAADCIKLINQEDRLVLDALDKARPALTAFIEAAEQPFTEGGRLIYIGAGTSGRLGVLDASEAPPTFQVDSARVVGIIAGGDAALRKSSESKEDDPTGAHDQLDALFLSPHDTIIGITSGGTTPFVLGALAHVKDRFPGCLTALIACTPIDRPTGVDHLLILETGPELLTGSTRMKAGTATKLALNTISTTLMVRSGRVYENLMVDLRATNDKLNDRAARIISTLTDLDRAQAFDLLEQAGGHVKTAIVMHKLKLDSATASRRLELSGQRLDRALERTDL